MAATAAPWGADLDTTLANVPGVTVTETSNPSMAQVQQWVTDYGSEVAFVIHGYDALLSTPADDKVATIETFASRVVSLGAASRVANAAWPESTGRASSPYERIRTEYLEARALLGKTVADMLSAQASTGDPDTPGAGDGGGATFVGSSGPDVRVPDGMRWGW